MASQLKVDTITGVTTAGSISVTGEGNSTTTNLQQGLAKAWIHFNGTASGAAANDSLNLSSMTDNGTADYTSAWSSVFSNAFYSVTGATEYSSIFTMQDNSTSQTTGGVRYVTVTDGGAAVDEEKVCTTNHGDLA